MLFKYIKKGSLETSIDKFCLFYSSEHDFVKTNTKKVLKPTCTLENARQ